MVIYYIHLIFISAGKSSVIDAVRDLRRKGFDDTAIRGDLKGKGYSRPRISQLMKQSTIPAYEYYAALL